MIVSFYKYQGAGNDFIIIDNRTNFFDADNHNLIKNLCDRRFGVGADGLMLLQDRDGVDFEMIYFNSDGFEGTMCGNGGRCIVAFAYHLEIIGEHTRFLAVDGEHEAIVKSPEYVKLKMSDVANIEVGDGHYFMDTGSPHYVTFVNNLDEFNVLKEGREIRYNERFRVVGTNVNFVELKEGALFVRTYERGVEDETYACGTGITAAAISAALKLDIEQSDFNIQALGGKLKVSCINEAGKFKSVWLQGPAKMVFSGSVDV